MISTVKKTVVSRSLLEHTAKVVKFSTEVNDFKILSDDFVGGVYVAEIVGLAIPDKPFTNDIVSEHILAADLIKVVLRDVPVTRDNDMLLLFEVWKRQGVVIELDDVDLDLMFSSETIRRTRQKIQNNDGLFLPTSYAVAKRRRINEDLLREYYGGLK